MKIPALDDDTLRYIQSEVSHDIREDENRIERIRWNNRSVLMLLNHIVKLEAEVTRLKKEKGLSNDELQKLAEKYPPPESWHGDDRNDLRNGTYPMKPILTKKEVEQRFHDDKITTYVFNTIEQAMDFVRYFANSYPFHIEFINDPNCCERCKQKAAALKLLEQYDGNESPQRQGSIPSREAVYSKLKQRSIDIQAGNEHGKDGE